MTDSDLPADLLARRALMDHERRAADGAVRAEAGAFGLFRLLGVELAIRLQAGFKLRTVADLDAFVLACREKELRAKGSGITPAEAAKVVRALCLWWEPRYLAELARLRAGPPRSRQLTFWCEDPS